MLIEKDADVNAVTEDRYSALIFAVTHGMVISRIIL